MLKSEFTPSSNWFKNFTVRIYLGYLGFGKDCACKEVFMPAKARKNVLLRPDQKRSNRELSSQRLAIQHSIVGLKRYRILSDRVHDIKAMILP